MITKKTLPKGKDPVWTFMGLLKQHPWHGVPIGAHVPDQVTAYIEIVPSDTVKYELDKFSGYLKIDRPQKYSNICPTPYGFIPQTFCAERVAEDCMKKTGLKGIAGDNDPLDICILSEKDITHGDILLQAFPIGGLRLIDGKEADDKILAVMKDDAAYGSWTDIKDCPKLLIERITHYFLTYKDLPGTKKRRCELMGIYGRKEAYEVIRRSHEDYKAHYGDLEWMLAQALKDNDKKH